MSSVRFQIEFEKKLDLLLRTFNSNGIRFGKNRFQLFSRSYFGITDKVKLQSFKTMYFPDFYFEFLMTSLDLFVLKIICFYLFF